MTVVEQVDALSELRANVAVPLQQARAMPRSVYTSPEFMQLEIRQDNSRANGCARGRSTSLAKPGDYLTMEVGGHPIIVLRDGDMSLRAMSNVCLHRMSTLLQGSGNTRTIVCPYHAWTYNLDGSLRGAPGMEKNEGFCKSGGGGGVIIACRPCAARTGWAGSWLAVDPDAVPVSERLSALTALVADYGMSDYVESFREKMTWKYELEGLGRELHGELPRPGLSQGQPSGHQVSLSECGVPGGDGDVQLSLRAEKRRPVSGARPPPRTPDFRGRSSTHLHHHHLSRPLSFRCRPATSGICRCIPGRRVRWT